MGFSHLYTVNLSFAIGNGYCRSEAVVAVFLQASEDAKRIYASLVHSKNNSDGYKQEGLD